MRSRHDIVARALVHVGHRETAPNDSPLIRAWLRRCGILQPAAWCAAFASWCVEEYWDTVESAPEFVKQAGALRLAALFPETRDPQPGDLMWFPTDDQGHGHIGIVIAVGATQALCVEGNSANMVRIVRRLRSEVRFSSTRPGARAEARTEILKPWAESLGYDPPLVHVGFDGTR